MKKILALLFAMVMVLSLFACTAQEAAEATEAPAEATEATAEATEAPAEATEAPAEATEAPAAAAVQRIIVWNNAITDLTASDQQRSEGDLRSAYSIKDVCDKCGIQVGDKASVIGSDGYVGEEVGSDLLLKYLTLEGENAPIVVGEAQDPDWAVWEVAYINFGTDVIMTSYKDKISVKDVFEAVGMADAESYDFICTDEYTQNVVAADIADCYISWIDDRIDAEVPGIGDYTLYSILYIQPHVG
ncbi:MAG: hypothetical protein ABFD03_10175 [Clostridiaceae bacterium]